MAGGVAEAYAKAKKGLNGEAIRLLRRVQVWSRDAQGQRLKANAIHLLDEASYEEVPQTEALKAVERLQVHLGIR